jgi:uncharacterized membrane protein YfcA
MDTLLATTMATAGATPWPLIVGGGFFIGFLIGITGVGAGSLTTPLLISGVGVPPALAVGTDLLFAAITKASAAWRHQKLGNVDWPILRWLAAGSIPGALAVLAWLYFAQPDTHVLATYVRETLAAMLIISALAIGLYPFLMRNKPKPDDTNPPRIIETFGLGVVLGSVVALTSVGAGAIGVVVLTGLYPTLLARRTVGTDIVHAIPLTFVAGMGHAGLGNVDPMILAGLLAGSIPGIAIGSRITGLIPDWALRIALSLVLCYAAYVLWNK